MNVTLNYNNWSLWGTYDPTQGLFGEQKVTFDGINRLILVNEGVTELDVQEDIYSAWKEWALIEDNLKYAQALSVVGGEYVSPTTRIGFTYFLENGWRIKSWAGNHILSVNGNIYTREPGLDPYVPSDGNFKVTINVVRSNLVELIEVNAALTEEDRIKIDELHKLQGLQKDHPLVVTDTLRTAGPTITQTVDGVNTVTIQRQDNQ